MSPQVRSILQIITAVLAAVMASGALGEGRPAMIAAAVLSALTGLGYGHQVGFSRGKRLSRL